ncbi:right-handed parallel beta-helix repeat-containing protein [Sandarakinorhabdus rubra]|uniref:right-handed parallel beta-helix repeat-containing protein n=1 Tax=Sandarakinorhabdus rubra TaxID=2672568 RepID=UPI0013D968A1|nr:right-handed parallel beta-helix repeat-containing protein [Sandarakinorhabdus rubra]
MRDRKMLGWSWLRALLLAIAMLAGPAWASGGTVLVMRPDNVAAVLAAVKPGDTIRMEGVFNSRLVITGRDFGGVKVDGRRAVLKEGLQLRLVHNISFDGLTIGSRDRGTIHLFGALVQTSSHISFSNMKVLGNLDGKGTGMRVLDSRFVTVRDSHFEGNVDGLQFLTTPDSLAVRNRFVRNESDGVKIVNSQRVIAAHNSCTDIRKAPKAHPDCIQLWSIVDKPLQSDIYILNNIAIGTTQGFTSFDPGSLSGTQLTFAGNYAAITYNHGITCSGCTDSRFLDNIVISLPESRNRAMIYHPLDRGNEAEGNQLFDLRGRFGGDLPLPSFTSLVPSIAGLVGSQWDDRSFGLLSDVASVPEPGIWLMMLAGWALVGVRLRRVRVRGRLPGCAA